MDLLRVNMERWRWLPRDFGSLYVWNNLPEFETRVVKDGEHHPSRAHHHRPAQHADAGILRYMVRVIFKPDWNVPESHQAVEHLGKSPRWRLRRPSAPQHAHHPRGASEINPAKLKYAELNARDVPIVMGPGSDNPLGNFKFVFPNKHDVYMHDTTSKGLFESSERTFSHGCIRVRDPQRFAEVVLGVAKGWNKADVRWQTRVKSTSKIELDRQIPIHNTYFTLVADASGTLRKLNDIYGHDKRMIDAFNGIDVTKIAAADPALALKKKNEDLASGAVVVAQPVRRNPSRPRTVAVVKKSSSAVSLIRPAPSFGQPLYLGRRTAAPRYRRRRGREDFSSSGECVRGYVRPESSSVASETGILVHIELVVRLL